jgi:hypothetical protein
MVIVQPPVIASLENVTQRIVVITEIKKTHCWIIRGAPVIAVNYGDCEVASSAWLRCSLPWYINRDCMSLTRGDIKKDQH